MLKNENEYIDGDGRKQHLDEEYNGDKNDPYYEDKYFRHIAKRCVRDDLRRDPKCYDNLGTACKCGITSTFKNAPNSAHSSWCPIYRRP